MNPTVDAKCEECKQPLSDATGWHKWHAGGIWHWNCLRCADKMTRGRFLSWRVVG